MSAARCVRSLLFAALIASITGLIILPKNARAEDWRWTSGKVEDEADAIVRFQTRLDLWVATFNRPDRACKSFGGFNEGPPPPTAGRSGLRAEQDEPGFFGCNAAHSKEIAFGPGVEVSFKVINPLHVAVGFDLIYTDPSGSSIKNQILFAVPFSILLTEYRWPLRPLLQATITPILYVTDDARDYTLGADAGVAWRVVDWGDLSLTIGYKTSETVKSWNFQVALHPI